MDPDTFNNILNINVHSPITIRYPINAYQLHLSYYLIAAIQSTVQESMPSGDQMIGPSPQILNYVRSFFETAIEISNANRVDQLLSEPPPAPIGVLVALLGDLSIDPYKCSQWVLASACASIAICTLWMCCGEALSAEAFDVTAHRTGSFLETKIVGLSEIGKAQLLPSPRLKEFYDSVDPLMPMLMEEQRQSKPAPKTDHEASLNDVKQTVFRDSDPIRNVVDAFLASRYAPAKHAKLSFPAVRIYLHSLGLNFTDNVGQLRAALGCLTKPLRPTVLKLSDQYGCLSHGGTLNDEALTAAECAQLAFLRKRKKTWQKLTKDQSLDREFRWLRWHSFLGNACFQSGPLQLPEWEGPVK